MITLYIWMVVTGVIGTALMNIANATEKWWFAVFGVLFLITAIVLSIIFTINVLTLLEGIRQLLTGIHGQHY